MMLSQVVRADEGMWLPALLNKINEKEMTEMGLKLTKEDLYSVNNSSLKDAIIALDHGSCTGELISNEGLFLTNHHCGYGEIQKHSSPENNYLRDGFWAMSRDEELPNPGKTVSFLLRVEDVTERVLAKVTDDMDETTRYDSIRSETKAIQKEAIGDTHYEANVRSIFNGNQYFLFVYETFKDVRLVGAPSSSIGKFGADTDNWMWPRHTGDFSMFRIYCGPDGKPAEYAEDNIPYTPRHFLPISLKGVEKEDFAMVMGYPGSTDRYLSSYGVKYTMEGVNQSRITVREQKLATMMEYMVTSDNANIQYASKYSRSSNYYKYSIGQNKGLEALNVMNKKKALEDEVEAWIAKDNARQDKYGMAVPLMREAYENTADDLAVQYMRETMFSGAELIRFAGSFKGLAKALESEDAEKIEKQQANLLEYIDNYFKDYDAATDEKLAARLNRIFAQSIDAQFYPEFIKEIEGKYKGNYEKWAAKLYQKTMFANKEKLVSFVNNPKAGVIEKDPGYQLSLEVVDHYYALSDMNAEDQEKLDKGNRLFTAALLEMNPEKSYYPNANSTMRLTYGSVGDYSPRDGVQYSHFTTLKGYIEKEIPGDHEFDVWPKLKELYLAKDYGRYADKDGSLHACFTTNNDITGGNSGSPVINGNGELIGCAFDGNWEAMSGDIAFEPELQKCICVDIRFVLWTVDKVAGASHLIEEMKIVE